MRENENERVYAGKLVWFSNDEEIEIVALSDQPTEPLAARISDDMDALGQYLSVRYYLADAPLSEAQLQDNYLQTVMGLGQAEYNVMYSEDTGYLWTTQELKVGGHNLLDELGPAHGRYLYLIIAYAHEKPPELSAGSTLAVFEISRAGSANSIPARQHGLQ